MDYEALGRHTEATEQAEKLLGEYQKRLKALGDELKRSEVSSSSGCHVPSFDVVKLRAQFDEVARLHASLMDAAREANIQAERCGRPKITTGRGPAFGTV